MDKRALIGITLSVLVLIAYQQFINYYYGTPPTDGSTPAGVKTEAEKTSAPVVAPSTATVAPAQTAPAEIPSGQSAKDFKVETDNYIAIFTTQGARLKSFKFKKFRSSPDEKSPPFEIVSNATGVPLPLGVRLQAPAAFDDGALIYAVQGADLKLPGDAKGTLVFQGQTSDGTVITKALTFSGASYSIGLEVGVKSADVAALVPEVLLTEKAIMRCPSTTHRSKGLSVWSTTRSNAKRLPKRPKGTSLAATFPGRDLATLIFSSPWCRKKARSTKSPCATPAPPWCPRSLGRRAPGATRCLSVPKSLTFLKRWAIN